MSGVGEAASVAGLIAIAGQSIDVVIRIISFVQRCRAVPSETQSVADELQLLHTSLVQTQSLAQRAQGIILDTPDTIDALGTSLRSCRDTVVEVEKKIAPLDSKRKPGIWTKLNIAGHHEYFTKLCKRVATAKQDLILKLSVLDCELNVKTASQINRLVTSAQSFGGDMALLVHTLTNDSGAARRYMESLDGRCQDMHRLLERSLGDQHPAEVTERRKSGPRTQYRVSPRAKILQRLGLLNSNQRPPVQQHFVRVVAEAWLVYFENGIQHWEPTTREIMPGKKLEPTKRQVLIKYILNLRILLWLFRRDNFLSTINASRQMNYAGYDFSLRTYSKITNNCTNSMLIKQEGLASFWDFNIAIHDTISTYKLASERRHQKIPWFTSCEWMGYFFDRVMEFEEEVGIVPLSELLGLLCEEFEVVYPTLPPVIQLLLYSMESGFKSE